MKVLHFKIKNSTFILRDQDILERNFHCRNYRIDITSQPAYLFALVKLFLYLLFAGWSYDVYFIRFADWHTALIAFFARIYRKRFYVVIGGFDVAAIPQYSYGAHSNSLRGKCVRYTLKHATGLLPNSESMIYYENHFLGDEIIYGGIRHFVPSTSARIEVVPNGFDGGLYQRRSGVEKRDLALTVAVVDRERTFYMKGIDKFIETARQLSSYEFLVVGISQALISRMKLTLPGNLRCREFMDTEELIGVYSEAKVFCLFSLSEGMSNVLCEAMLCECIPVGTQITSVPEIIGEAGFLIREPAESYAEKVRMAFEADAQLGIASRNRILMNYNMKQREEKIVSILSGSVSPPD